jgi:hypothetical protein
MTDEHLLRQWADAHTEFTGDLDRGLLRLGRFVNRRLQHRRAHSPAYAPTSCLATPVDHAQGSTARAALAGAMACLATTVLLLAVAALTTAGTHGAAGLAVLNPALVA